MVAIEVQLATTHLDTLEVLLSCRAGICALLAPDADLNVRVRDHVATLMDVLDQCEAATVQALRRERLAR